MSVAIWISHFQNIKKVLKQLMCSVQVIVYGVSWISFQSLNIGKNGDSKNISFWSHKWTLKCVEKIEK